MNVHFAFPSLIPSEKDTILWRSAYITPLFKKGDWYRTNRPVSRISICKLAYSYVIIYLEVTGVLSAEAFAIHKDYIM